MRTISVLMVVGLCLIPCGTGKCAWAEETPVSVRVISKGAKFIGTSMGGMRITIRNTETGELLAQGVTAGGTGNTDRIMKTEALRTAPIADSSAAAFNASLDLKEPTPVEITAFGPLAHREGAQKTSQTMWLLPGMGLDQGDGIVLEVPGLIVDAQINKPVVKWASETIGYELSVNMMMMCGCPIEPDGLWATDDIQTKALLFKSGQPVEEIELSYSGLKSRYTASFEVDAPGPYEVQVWAVDNLGNTGLDREPFVIK